ncbi:catechol 2,3-dioxygenase-like lactoylglutathione lyase family enzyme [Inquilinus ginsengisoli]|uniref:Catechol 2,3-dioxygenase-like lactoylglutathione lyase family enzyme n=1 Tax=Inquilinus ginsengisoli TaxID=363840 RepID=A0ABU1JTT1_9PROT|nr:VOC family protein [Inquilinus ginsengisoli]MDR6292031.1 catechol 2,3-dioxygenase-like lactoylglutathione lyase family enzyme [Inquilinus ginsengisoli]
MTATPRISGLLETSLYVADLDRASAFYEGVLGLRVMLRSPRLVALDAGRQGVLLLFLAGATSADVVEAGGTIPGHEGAGRLHMAFAVPAEDLDAWRARLATAGVALTGEMAWARGGVSLYIADPDGHVVELATPGLWPNY